MDYVQRWNQNRVDWLYELARCNELGARAVRVGLLFATFFQPEAREELKPSYAWLTKHAHMSRTTLANALVELEEAGFLLITRYHAESQIYTMPFMGDAKWVRERTKPFVAKVRKNPPNGKRPRKTIESKN